MFKIHQNTLKIQQFISDYKPGDYISFEEIEEGTGVQMDNRGRGYLRTALNRLKFEYLPVIGKGIELVNEDSSVSAINRRVLSIDRSVKRGTKTQKRVVDKFYDKLSPQDQKRADFVGGVFAVIKADAQAIRKVISRKKTAEMLSEKDDPKKYYKEK